MIIASKQNSQRPQHSNDHQSNFSTFRPKKLTTKMKLKLKDHHHYYQLLQRYQQEEEQFYRPLSNEFSDEWLWNPNDKSDAVKISDKNFGKTAYFHIGWSNGTAGVRGTKPINIYKNNKYYWEVLLKDKVFGTSMMVGLSTKRARLHSSSYINLIGENRFGWGLSHKGLLWHNGQWKEYTQPFQENQTTLVGCLFDGLHGTLTYYKDGECLGVAFSGLNLVNENLYPTISSTAAQSQFVLTFAKREYLNLQDRCRDVINRTFALPENKNKWSQVLPERILSYLTFEDEYHEAKRREHFSFRQLKRANSVKIKEIPENSFYVRDLIPTTIEL